MLDTTHPLWCTPARCETLLDGGHSAEPRAIDFDPHHAGFVRVRLWQRRPFIGGDGFEHASPLLLEFAAGNRDTGQVIRADLTLAQTRQLQALLVSTLIAAGDDDTHADIRTDTRT